MENYALVGGAIFALLGIVWVIRGNFYEAATLIAIGTSFWAGLQRGEGARDIPNRKMLIWLGIIVAVVLYIIQALRDFRVF